MHGDVDRVCFAIPRWGPRTTVLAARSLNSAAATWWPKASPTRRWLLAAVSIRNLDDDVKERLCARAASHGRAVDLIGVCVPSAVGRMWARSLPVRRGSVGQRTSTARHRLLGTSDK